MLRKEYVLSVLEYSTNEMLISVQTTSMLICKDWQIIKEIKDPNAANIDKFWMTPLPGFHTKSWPYILIAGD